MKAFDESRKFGRVRGIPGVLYEQDGQLFNAQKEPMRHDERTGEWVVSKPTTSNQAQPTKGETETTKAGASETSASKPKSSKSTKKKASSGSRSGGASKAKTPANQPKVPEGVRPLREQVKDEA